MNGDVISLELLWVLRPIGGSDESARIMAKRVPNNEKQHP